jgi:hypothetical protein
MALLNTFHTSEFREGWGATLRTGPALSFARQSMRLAILLALLVTGSLFFYLKAFRNSSLWGGGEPWEARWWALRGGLSPNPTT